MSKETDKTIDPEWIKHIVDEITEHSKTAPNRNGRLYPQEVFDDLERSFGRFTFKNNSKRYRHEYRLYINERFIKLEVFHVVKSKNTTTVKTQKPIKEIKNDLDAILRYIKKRVTEEQYIEVEKFCFEKT